MSGLRAELFDVAGRKRLGSIEVASGPVCGEDFCESCEDCMSCFPCGHARVVYEDQLDEFLTEHEGAVVTLDAP